MTRMTTVMRDHPGWTTLGGIWLRAASTTQGPPQLLGTAEEPPRPDVIELPDPLAPTVPEQLERAIRSLGVVARWRNPSLWDALATAILRQVIRADQARLLHQRFRAAFGPAVSTPYGPVHALPAPEQVTAMTVTDFASVRMTFHASVLNAAAEAYLLHGAKWAELPPRRLVEELQTIPRVGPWTAGAAVADYTHDFTLYPYGDLAVRKWAQTAAPDIDWPTTEKPFAGRWRHLAGEHLSTLTLFTIAWGGQHGGPT